MKPLLIALGALIGAAHAHADGLPLKDGRCPGAVLVFSLTSAQKHAIEHYRTCQLERQLNVYTPYVFTLTSDQAKDLTAAKGFSPSTFSIFETYRGFNDAGPHWNVVLRFDEDQIEVPLDLLVSDREAAEWHEQFWDSSRRNPCFPDLQIPSAPTIPAGPIESPNNALQPTRAAEPNSQREPTRSGPRG